MIPSVLFVRSYDVHPNPISYRESVRVSSGFRRSGAVRLAPRSLVPAVQGSSICIHRMCTGHQPSPGALPGRPSGSIAHTRPPADALAGHERPHTPSRAAANRTDTRIHCEQLFTGANTPSVTPPISALHALSATLRPHSPQRANAHALGIVAHCGKKFVSTTKSACTKSGMVILCPVATAVVHNRRSQATHKVNVRRPHGTTARPTPAHQQRAERWPS